MFPHRYNHTYALKKNKNASTYHYMHHHHTIDILYYYMYYILYDIYASHPRTHPNN